MVRTRLKPLLGVGLGVALTLGACAGDVAGAFGDADATAPASQRGDAGTRLPGPQADAAVAPPDAAVASPDAGPPPAPLLCRIELTCDGPIPDEPKRDCGLVIEDGDGLGVYVGEAGIERRGRSSSSYPKPNYSLELRDSSGAEAPTNLLGMGRESDWILDGSWVDRSFVRNELAFSLYRSLGPTRWAPRGRFCEVWLDDEARGIYRLGERIKRDDDRIDIPVDDGSGQSFVVKQDSDGVLRWDVGEGASWKLVSPNQDRTTDAQRAGVQRFLDALDAALRDPERDDPFALLDLDAVVDFVIVQELAKSADAYNLSLHIFKAPGAPAQLVPWDFDLSMGQPNSRIRPGNELSSLWVLHRTELSDGIDGLVHFRTRLSERWRLHRQGPLSESAVMAHIDHALETLTPAALDANFRLWPLEDVDFQFIYDPYTLYPVTSHDAEIGRVKAWLRERLLWIDAHIDDYPN